ncbi:MAG: hypothetical protein ACK53E_13470, partial [Pseudanabaena sp.]
MLKKIVDAANSLKESIESEIEKISPPWNNWGKDESEQELESVTKRPKKDKYQQIPTTYTLVLAVRATKLSILNSLQRGDYISSENADKLYQSAKFLWLGSQQNFTSNFSDLFFPRHLGIDTNEESEYDIYLLRI